MEFRTDIFSQFDRKWGLVTAGNKDAFNTMTVSWGGLGTLWGKPVATVYIRTSRYTHDFVEGNDYPKFTGIISNYFLPLMPMGSCRTGSMFPSAV